MELLELKNLNRKDIPLQYISEFSCAAVFRKPAYQGSGSIESPVEFRIEQSPFGKKEVYVKLLGSFDYPLLPMIRHLKEHISDLDRKGLLPRT